jgi:hypothetical protein
VLTIVAGGVSEEQKAGVAVKRRQKTKEKKRKKRGKAKGNAAIDGKEEKRAKQ